MEKAADPVVVALHSAGARLQAAGDLHQEVYLARQHGIDFQKVRLGQMLSAVGVQPELGTVLLVEGPQFPFSVCLLLQ